MQTIPIYESETAIAGLADQIMAQSSVAFQNLLEPATPDVQEAMAKSIAGLDSSSPLIKALASQNDSDLYYTKSILVSTCWNKNKDVFSPVETWAARHTPSHKPTNLEHDETKLVGHIVDSYAIDGDGSLIPDNSTVDKLPYKFHLVTGSVIYKNWESQPLVERTAALIEQIEAGEKYVSMEVLFTDFDYAVISPDGNHTTKARTNDTAWMTKHLSAYGGSGEYDGFKIGRLLKNLTFCGKGYVDKPANPESVIFSAGTDFKFTSASKKTESSEDVGVSNLIEGDVSSNNNNKGETHMSEQLLKDQAAKAEAKAAELEKKLAEATAKLADADVAQFTSKIEDLQGQVEAKDKSIADISEELTTAKASLKESTEALATEKEAKATLETAMEEIKAAEAKANRVSTLVDGGIEKEIATEKVDTFANLNDEQFTVVADELIKAAKVQTSAAFPPKKDDEKEEDKDKKDKKDKKDSKASEEETDENEANADETALEEVETEAEVTLAGDETTEEEVDTTAELSKVIAAYMSEARKTGKKNTEGDK